MRDFDYYRPGSAKEASRLLAGTSGTSAKAGGTDLLPMLKSGVAEVRGVVNLLGVEELEGITVSGEEISIGATTTIASLAENEDVQRAAPGVAEAARLTATPLIRNRATLGGNLAQRPRCWYFRNQEYPCLKKGGATCYAREGENKYHAIFENFMCCMVHPSNLAPALWTHEARVHVIGPRGERSIPMNRFFARPGEKPDSEVRLNPGEVITRVTLKPRGPRSGSSYVEVREKQSFDWALVSAACHLTLDGGGKVERCAVVVSSVAPVPLRRWEAEHVISGRKITEESALEAGEAALEGASPLRDNAYKLRMLKACVADAILEAGRRAEEK